MPTDEFSTITDCLLFFLTETSSQSGKGGVKLSRNRQAAAELSGDGNSPFLLAFLSV